MVISNYKNLYLTFKAAFRNYYDGIALKGEGGLGKVFTYNKLSDHVERFGLYLSQEEFSSIKEIGLLSENRPEWAIAYLAIIASGKTVVPIDANLKSNEISFILDHAGLRMVITSEKFEKILQGLSEHLSIFSFDPDSPNYWQTPVEQAYLTDKKLPEISSDDHPAALIYTSGTTGRPKAVVLTHGNLLNNLEGIQQTLKFDLKDTFLSVLPLHHTFESTCGFLTPLMAGACIVYARSLKSNDLLEDIKHNNITIMCGVPLLFENIYRSIQRKIAASGPLKQATFKTMFKLSAAGWKLKIPAGETLFKDIRAKTGLNSIRMFVSGGAAIPPEIVKFFNYLGFCLLPGYGLTECSPVVSVNLPDNIIFQSVGPPLPNLEIKIDSPGEDGIGEILVRGGSVTPGYRDNPEATSEILKDGWLYTGDLGYLRKGILYITGRRKNLIVSAAGKNIYPEEIEEKLMTSVYIAETVVFGRKKDNKQGEEVRGIIVPELEQFANEFEMSKEQPDMTVIKNTISQVVKHINDELAAYKRLTAYDIQLEELEKTSTKKVKRYHYS